MSIPIIIRTSILSCVLHESLVQRSLHGSSNTMLCQSSQVLHWPTNHGCHDKAISGQCVAGGCHQPGLLLPPHGHRPQRGLVLEKINLRKFTKLIHFLLLFRYVKPHLTTDPRGPWEIVWNYLVDNYMGEDTRWNYIFGNWFFTLRKKMSFSVPYLIETGATLYSATWYWFTALVFLAVDFSQNPKMVTKFKTQPGKNAPPPLKKVLKVINN